MRKALVMAGGFGTRLKELTKDTPKPMLPLQGKPILEYTVDLCRRFGIRDIAMSVFYHKDRIKEYFGDGSKWGVKIRYVEETEPLGTGGALLLARNFLDEPFMMCNADELKDIDLEEMEQQHLSTGALATLALTHVEDPSAYGVADLEGEKIHKFVEKPKIEEAPSKWISAGLYIMSPSVIRMVPEGFTMIEKALFPKIAKKGLLFGYKFYGQWFDTGTPERYANAENGWMGFTEVKAAKVE